MPKRLLKKLKLERNITKTKLPDGRKMLDLLRKSQRESKRYLESR